MEIVQPYMKATTLIGSESKEDITHLKGVEMYDDLYGYIEVSLGQTINLGNFNSARCDVSLRYPTPATPLADVNATYDTVYNWVQDKLGGIITEIHEAYKVK